MAFKVLKNILGADFRADYSGQGVERNVPEFRSVVNNKSSMRHHKLTKSRVYSERGSNEFRILICKRIS